MGLLNMHLFVALFIYLSYNYNALVGEGLLSWQPSHAFTNSITGVYQCVCIDQLLRWQTNAKPITIFFVLMCFQIFDT